ncbi:RING-H2 finger protein ATL57-like [Dendrobium catenatum]|uniref:RING-type E3 ubiquitin transferase n=1 Tax=Dendrobium catenatum TaxID=906689 RepID=A0A2I0WS21_9ASPA|nr:RING-H2 finger protein ATL57-like [Dendrobium catenatum]PKU78460.1 RING-H2 finger protein ATL57 [Dendrobium catenatum]
MNADFVSGDASIPTSSSATTSIDYHSPIGFTVLVSVVALFIICSFVVFAQNCFANQHHDQATTTPAYPRVLSVAVPPLPGLDAAAVAALPVVRYNGGGGEGCAVCLVEYGVKEMVKVIPGCGHGFHSECIDTWLIRRGSCPVCRCSELRGPSSGEVCVGVFGSGEGNLCGKTSMSCDRCCSKAEAGGSPGEMFLRRTCSV